MMDLSNLLSVLKCFSRRRLISSIRGLFSEVGESLHLEHVKALLENIGCFLDLPDLLLSVFVLNRVISSYGFLVSKLNS